MHSGGSWGRTIKVDHTTWITTPGLPPGNGRSPCHQGRLRWRVPCCLFSLSFSTTFTALLYLYRLILWTWERLYTWGGLKCAFVWIVQRWLCCCQDVKIQLLANFPLVLRWLCWCQDVKIQLLSNFPLVQRWLCCCQDVKIQLLSNFPLVQRWLCCCQDVKIQLLSNFPLVQRWLCCCQDVKIQLLANFPLATGQSLIAGKIGNTT